MDVKKAYFNILPMRDIYLSPPRELGLPKSLLAKQMKCVYGTRDAGMIWEETYRAALAEIGSTAGRASPCCLFSIRIAPFILSCMGTTTPPWDCEPSWIGTNNG